MITYMFPGQGSQKKGMGETLFEEFKELTLQADEVLGYSIKDICIEDSNRYLNLTQYTQPALYTVNALYYLKKVQETGRKPDYAIGHSLGEYNALFAAGVYDFVTGLQLVKKRGELMSRAAGGGMAAVIGLTGQQITEVLRQNNLESIDLANFNSPRQIVISGLIADIEKAQPCFERHSAIQMFIPLKTSGAFHSRYMEEARMEFAELLNTYTLYQPAIPVISNVHAKPYHQSDVKQNLIDQITHPVRWTDSIRYLLDFEDMEFVEIGPGNVLTGLLRRIQREA